MSPPKNQRGCSPSKSSPATKKAKVLVDNERAAEREVKGQPKVNKTATMEPSAKRALIMDPEQESETPPQWFLTFFKEFELRLESRIVKRLDDLTSKVVEQDEKMRSMDFDIHSVQHEITQLKDANETLLNKVDDLENRSRRNNLVLFGFPESEQQEDCHKVVAEFLQFVGAQPDDMAAVQRCHRTPTHRYPGLGDKPRIIHVAFGTFTAKENIRKASIQKLKACKEYKAKKVFVGEDLSRRVQEQRKKKMELFKRLRQDGKKPFFSWPDKIRYRDHTTGNIVKVD